MTAGLPAPLLPAEALAQLRAPGALEHFSVLTGDRALVIDLRGACALSDPAVAELCERMSEAACPTIGLGPFGPSAPQLLRESVDLLISDQEDLVAVAATLESRPLASLALVQLLRLGQGRAGPPR